MTKKKREITDFQFKAGFVIVVLLIIAVFYFAIVEERFRVREDSFMEKPLISPDHPLAYKTEFCANRLTELAHEIHFLEREITAEKKILGEEKIVKEEEQEVIQIEQRELEEIRSEFETYKSMCDQFDKEPTTGLCTTFLQEAQNSFELAQKNAEETTGLKHVGISLKYLRKASRIYQGLQKMCADVE